MVLYALKKDFDFDVSYGDVIKLPEFGIYDYRTKKVFEDFEEYKKVYSQEPNPPLFQFFLTFFRFAGINNSLILSASN